MVQSGGERFGSGCIAPLVDERPDVRRLMMKTLSFMLVPAILAACPRLLVAEEPPGFEVSIADGLAPSCSLEEVLSHAPRIFGSDFSINRVAYVQGSDLRGVDPRVGLAPDYPVWAVIGKGRIPMRIAFTGTAVGTHGYYLVHPKSCGADGGGIFDGKLDLP